MNLTEETMQRLALLFAEGSREEAANLLDRECSNNLPLLDAAIDGLGVAVLPDHVCMDALEAGRLVRVLPAWRGVQGIVHLVFTTRRGLPPAVRAFINHLATTFAD